MQFAETKPGRDSYQKDSNKQVENHELKRTRSGGVDFDYFSLI